jgi:lauroyl/myristoyl acyltransferase
LPSRALRAFQLGAGIARATPGPLAHLLFRIGSNLAVPIAGDRRHQVERNLRRIHGADFGGLALRRAVAETFESYARYWAESFRLPETSPAALDAGFRIEGYDRIETARADGRGVILALPHLGPWEWAGFWLAEVAEVPITVVVEPLEPPDVYKWFVDLRESLGMHVVPLGAGVTGEVMGALRDNHVLGLLCDRDLGGGGIEVEFFGETTTLPAGPATLALRTGAPLLPTGVYHEGSGRVGIVRPPLDTTRQGRLRDDVVRVTQALAGELEWLIRQAPAQWHMLQPNWPSDLATEDAPA